MKLCAAIIVFLIALVPAFGQEKTPEKIATGELPSLLSIYKDLHAHPELSTREEKSSAVVAKELRAAGCEVTENFGKYDNPNLKCYGVIGVMKNGAGPTVLVRTDLDALPVEAFIGTARALQQMKDEWSGTIIFVGQPAEEAVGGARALLKAGLYSRFAKPDFALGFHDKADLQTGHIGVTPGYTYANVDSVDVTVRGIGGHGAYPHKTKDPIVLAAEMINTWQTIASRENNPLDPIVVTVGSIHGGTKHNIIPDEVKMQLTVRTYKAEVRDRVLKAIDDIAKGIASAAGVPADRAPIVNVLKDQLTPATYNNPELTKRLVEVWKKNIGAENVDIVDPTMGGEDFSEYSLPDHSIPAVDFHLGAVDPEKIAQFKKEGKELPSLHSSKFAPVPEPTIKIGIIGMTSAVLELLKK
ncbi:MAG: amidohydrolase [Verrucomicrobia bacterium]|nr:MAG: amidohydrolase [Verrucomicrobiota bacterium]